MTTHRQAHFFSFVMASGYHEAAWRVLNDDVVAASTTDHVIRSVAIAERGLLDAAFLADAPRITRFFPQLSYDPITLLTAAGQLSQRIGLVATASTTWNEPFEVARR